MDFHILDLIMYFPCIGVVYMLMPSDFKEEIGLLIGAPIILVATIVYIVLFAYYPNWNWSEIFGSINFTW